MAKGWNEAEDGFLLTFADAVGAERVATHDLSKPAGAGTKRLAHLIETGAAAFYAQQQFSRCEYMLRAGLHRKGSEAEDFTEEARDMWKERFDRWSNQPAPAMDAAMKKDAHHG